MRWVRKQALRMTGMAMNGFGLGLTRLPGITSLKDAVQGRLVPWAYARLTAHERELIETAGHRFYVNPRDRGVAQDLLIHGEYEPFEGGLFAAAISEGDTVLDVGANVGLYTVVAAGRVGPDGRVFSFEPDRANFALLTENVALNGYEDRVVTVSSAVASEAGTRTFAHHPENLGLHTFAPDDAEPGEGWTSITTVGTVSLDEFVAERRTKVDVVKIDAQGAEELIVSGATALLSSAPLTVFMEWWPDGLRALGSDATRLLDRLRALGFSIEVIDEEQRLLRKLADAEAEAATASGGYLNLRLTKAADLRSGS